MKLIKLSQQSLNWEPFFCLNNLGKVICLSSSICFTFKKCKFFNINILKRFIHFSCNKKSILAGKMYFLSPLEGYSIMQSNSVWRTIFTQYYTTLVCDFGQYRQFSS